MSSKLLLAAALFAGTMLTPVAGATWDRGDNDFIAVSQGYDDDSVTDLDELSPQQLDQQLNNELDDIFESIGENEYVSVNEAYLAVMDALSDAGDDGYESTIDFDELQAEMEEAGTSLEQEVAIAVNQADLYASGAASGIYKIVSRNLHPVASDGRTTGGAAFGHSKSRIVGKTRAR